MSVTACAKEDWYESVGPLVLAMVPNGPSDGPRSCLAQTRSAGLSKQSLVGASGVALQMRFIRGVAPAKSTRSLRPGGFLSQICRRASPRVPQIGQAETAFAYLGLIEAASVVEDCQLALTIFNLIVTDASGGVGMAPDIRHRFADGGDEVLGHLGGDGCVDRTFK